MILGSRGFDPIRRAAMGSVSDSVVRYAHYPVLVVRQEDEGEARGCPQKGWPGARTDQKT